MESTPFPPLPHTESVAQTEPSPDKATSNRALLAEKTVVPDSLDLLTERIPRSLPYSPHLVSLGRARVSLPHLRSLNLTAWPLSGSIQSERFSSDAAAMAASARRQDPQHVRTTIPDWHDSSNGFHLQICPDTTSPSQLADFFMLLFGRVATNTIRNYRSAIGTIHSGFPDGSAVGTSQAFALLKGMANRRPTSQAPTSLSINGVLHTWPAHRLNQWAHPSSGTLPSRHYSWWLLPPPGGGVACTHCPQHKDTSVSTAKAYVWFRTLGSSLRTRRSPSYQEISSSRSCPWPPTLQRTSCGAR
ncbi:hypothetical protein BSL78_04327 [Apostichopus japonicus]|uniref:Core-binding (CB) domain-containing protein n=1 Tax=Stichopus japonicus TaxID=307972 RepID=A0A2G8LEV5_STIJA|nr:hypothetical protein BSL78_04327 [Apostichopus japonicus]